MRPKLAFIIFLLGFSLLPRFSFAIDRETLWSKLNFPGPLNQFLETKRIAMQNPGLVEEILFRSDMSGDTSCARENAIQILKSCGEKGIISQVHFFDLCLQLYNRIDSVAHPKRVADSKNDISAALANFAGAENFSLSQQFSGLVSSLNSLSAAGLVKNQGILNGLSQKISNAQKSAETKSPNGKATAVNQLEATLQELGAQKGKGITEDCHKILSRYCQSLITKIQKGN